MNEITRIHIAKTAYDIEILAKKQLEKYMKSLESYTQDSDVLADIEIRITELLAERGVKAGGVISAADITAVRAQLGEPYEFADGEGDIAVGNSPVAAPHASTKRRLYRSTDDAVLAGVLSGIAAYFGINPLWTRLGFIVLLFASFGFAFVAYIVLWIIIPPARTAAEKLQLAGKEVTVASIQALNAEEDATNQSTRIAPAVQRTLGVIMGSFSLVGAIIAFAAAIWAVVTSLLFEGVMPHIFSHFSDTGEVAWVVWFIFWLCITGLLLLSALFGLIAYAFFARKLTKTMVISGIVIIALGIASAGTAIGVGVTQAWREAEATRNLMQQTNGQLPAEVQLQKSAIVNIIPASKGIVIDQSFNVDVRYVVDTSGPARYSLDALPGTKVSTAVKEGGVTTYTIQTSGEHKLTPFVKTSLTIYGPALDTLTAEKGNIYYDTQQQKNMTLVVKDAATIVTSASIEAVHIQGSGRVDLTASSIGSLTVQSQAGLVANAGTVRSLSVTQPDVCPSGNRAYDTSVSVSGVVAQTMMYNGKEVPAKNIEANCGTVYVEDAEPAQY